MFADDVNPQRVLTRRRLVAMGTGVASIDHVLGVHVAVHIRRALGGVGACAAIPQVVHAAPKGQLAHVNWNNGHDLFRTHLTVAYFLRAQ